VKNINIRNYKTWIIIFGFSNILLLLWSIELLPITKKFIYKENEIITITPKYKFIKIAPPKDKQFPNDKSDIWDVYNEDDKKLKNNTEKVDKVNKVLENNNVNKLKSSDTTFKGSQEFKTNKGKNSKNDNLSYSNKITKNKLEKIEDKSNNKANIKKIVKTKSFYVQTASLSKKEQVAIEWDRIQKKYKLDVENLIFITEKTKLKNNQIFYRLLVGRFKSNDDAKSFCKKLNFNKSCIIKIIE
jgi:hypothetical protein